MQAAAKRCGGSVKWCGRSTKNVAGVDPLFRGSSAGMAGRVV